MKVLIVGNGYAGSLLNYFLFKKGVIVHLIDRNENATSTKVSAGIMLPLTGRRIVKTYNADKIIPFATKVYNELEKSSGLNFLKCRDVLQLFSSPGNMNEWFASTEDPGTKDYTGSILKKEEIHHTITNEFGGIFMKQSGSVDPLILIDAIERLTTEHTKYFQVQFSYNDLQVESDEIIYNGSKYDYLIFCQGHETTGNLWFKYIPFKPAKGEILNFTSPELDDRYIINSSVFILPEGDGKFRAGSTYNWADLTNTPTQSARKVLEDGIQKSISCDFKITDHKAGIRPSIIDRRPVLGFHPQFPRVGIFNGLGTKGAMLAPYYANQFAEKITEGTSTDPDVSIRRFDSLYQAL